MNPAPYGRSSGRPALMALLILAMILLGIASCVGGVVLGAHDRYSDGTTRYYFPMGEALYLPVQLAGCALLAGALFLIIYLMIRRR